MYRKEKNMTETQDLLEAAIMALHALQQHDEGDRIFHPVVQSFLKKAIAKANLINPISPKPQG